MIDKLLIYLESTGYLNGSVMSEEVDMAILARNIQLVAESLARYMFALSDSGLVCLLHPTNNDTNKDDR